MPRNSFPGVMVLIALIVTACKPAAATGGGPSGTAGPRTAVLNDLQNDVQARAGAEGEWKPASEGEEIGVGGGARTGEASRLRVDLSDGTIVRLAPQTEFKLTAFAPDPQTPTTQLTLAAGKVWTFVSDSLAGNFEISTPSGAATVRGSYLSGQLNADGSFNITCLEGRCRLTGTSGKFTDLGNGQKSFIAGAGQDPAPAQPMDQADYDDWAKNFPESQIILGTPTPPGGGTSGQTACDHPYFPLRSGASWAYSSSSGPVNWSVASVQGDSSSATADMAWSVGDVNGTYHWLCDATGLVSYQFGSLSTSQQGQIANYTVVSHSGAFLPPADLLQPGHSWTNDYTISYDFTAGGSTVPATATVSEQSSVVSADPVTVNGKSFDGLQISLSTVMDIQIQFSGVSVPSTHIESSSTIVFARGVGIVQWTTSGTGGTDTVQLTDYSLP